MNMNSKKSVTGSSDWYLKEQLDFDRKLIHYRHKTIKKFIQGPIGLELGPAEGEMTKYLINDFEYLTSVDGSLELLKKIPYYKKHKKVHSLFEDYKPEKKFNTIIMEHILEHVDDPVKIMKSASNWLADNGVIILGVPNAFSIHRLAAVKMGLLQSPFELNERDFKLGHQRVYSMNTLLDDIHKTDLKIIEKGGVFFKPLSNSQIEKNWSQEMMDGFYQLGYDFPENSAEIYVICKK
jgi:2-polyprenyl-3-methyl-5-hydroxy-6-metoxy-1,4-benzoquinol methylase